MFTKYELQIIREAVIDNLDSWEEKVESGDDISPRFLKTLRGLEEKIDKAIEEAKE